MAAPKFRLKSLGRVFGPEHFSGFSSHAQGATPILLSDRIRLYFAARKPNGRSYPTYVDLDPDPPFAVRLNFKEPVLGFGNPGAFDSDGIMPSYAMQMGQEIWMYYSGWNQKVSTPYHNSMGLVRSRDNGQTFERMFEGPIMDRDKDDPYIVVTPTIIRIGNQLRMLYVSGTAWVKGKDRFEPVYRIKSAHSTDGINWTREPGFCLNTVLEDEAQSRGSIIRDKLGYHMLFCWRGSQDFRDGGSQSYRPGYAFSPDGIKWTRNDQAVEFLNDGDWDSKAFSYPYFLTVGESTYVFYNGNDFGKTGIGIAKWESL